MKNFGSRLRQLRKAQRPRLTLRTLADRVGIHYTTLGEYERGKTRPGLQVLERWCAELGATLDIVLTDEPVPDLPAQHAELLRQLLEALPDLSEQGVGVLSDMISALRQRRQNGE